MFFKFFCIFKKNYVIFRLFVFLIKNRNMMLFWCIILNEKVVLILCYNNREIDRDVKIVIEIVKLERMKS